MNPLIGRILAYVNGTLLFDDYYRFCLYVIYHYTEIEDIDISRILEATPIKKESILEFCKLVGFSNFDEFKQSIMHHNLLRVDQIRARMLGIDLKSMMHTMEKDITDEELEELLHTLCKAIYNAKRVVLIGAMYPMSIAVEFQTDLITFGKPVIQFHHFDEDLHFEKGDVTIFISATGRSMNDIMQIKQSFAVEETTSILITQNQLYTTPEHKITDHVLYVPGRFDGIHFNYQIMNIFDLLRLCYYQQYYL